MSAKRRVKVSVREVAAQIAEDPRLRGKINQVDALAMLGAFGKMVRAMPTQDAVFFLAGVVDLAGNQ